MIVKIDLNITSHFMTSVSTDIVLEIHTFIIVSTKITTYIIPIVKDDLHCHKYLHIYQFEC